MYTKEMLFQQLHTLGVPQNRPVIVHTSLRAVGAVEGRGMGLLDALRSYVTADGGLLCIPTHTWQRSEDDVHPTLDLASDEVCIGTLAKLAALAPGGHRSPHPTHSMAVFGDDARAEAFIAHDALVETSSDPRGCLGQIEREDGWILLIGVGQERNTYLHAVEEEQQVPNRLTAAPYPATVRHVDGRTETHPLRLIRSEGIDDVSDFFPKLEPAFRAAGAIRDGFVGDAAAQLCRARALREVFSGIIRRSRGSELFADARPLDPALYNGFALRYNTEKK